MLRNFPLKFFRASVELSQIKGMTYTRYISILALMLTGLVSPGALRAQIYVANQFGNDVEEFNSAGVGTIFSSSSLLDNPDGLAVAANGNVFVANSLNGTIVEITPQGNASVFASGLNHPLDLAFDAGGNLYVSNTGDNTVDKITPLGNVSVYIPASLTGPRGLAFDASGNLYVAYDGNNSIQKFTPSGSQTTFANTGLNSPGALAFDPKGNLYAANFGNSVIEEFSPSGTPSPFAVVSDPTGLSFDTNGNLFAVNGSNYTVEEITPNGSESTFASTGLTPGGIGVNPPAGFTIPEIASTGALLASSFGALLALRRHWRRVQ